MPDCSVMRWLLPFLWLSYGSDDLLALAKHCTEEEDAAKKAERQVA